MTSLAPRRRRSSVAARSRRAGTAWAAPQGMVLVVEDHDAVRASTEAVLRAGGFATVSAADGISALDALRHRRVDMIVLDLGLPHLDGRGVLEALPRPVPVVVVSGFRDDTESAIRARFGPRVVECLRKPVAPHRLVAAATAALAAG